MRRRAVLIALCKLALGACASMPGKDPLQVTVAGIEALPGEGMELRMLVNLRVQNPNSSPIEFSGVYVDLDVQDRTFATGVSSEAGTVPAFGEAVVAVPVTISVLRMVRQVIGMLDGKPVQKIDYELGVKLSGGMFGTERFEARGEFDLAQLQAQPGAT